VNEYVEPGKPEIDLLKIDPKVEAEQGARLAALRNRRDNAKTKACLDAVRKSAKDGSNLMPKILDAVRSYATLGEVIGVMKQVFGEYREPPTYW
jgi:methylmalonyl-CoA mutase N-terminal domain/subunit